MRYFLEHRLELPIIGTRGNTREECEKRYQWQTGNRRGRPLFDRGMQIGHAVTRRRLYLARVQPNRRRWKKELQEDKKYEHMEGLPRWR